MTGAIVALLLSAQNLFNTNDSDDIIVDVKSKRQRALEAREQYEEAQRQLLGLPSKLDHHPIIYNDSDLFDDWYYGLKTDEEVEEIRRQRNEQRVKEQKEKEKQLKQIMKEYDKAQKHKSA